MKNHPIFVVGQPRSGSTIVTRILNDAPGLFVVNDFYVLQKIDGAALWGLLTPEQARKIASWIYRILEIRSAQEIGKTLNQPIHLTLEQLSSLKELVHQRWPDGIYWHQILDEVMSRAAHLAGCDRWGYNTPQDHLHLKKLFDAYPNCRVILQLRHPEPVLNSYKNATGWWHDPRRYNPFTIAIAWRAAAQSYETWLEKFPNQILFVRYEDLVAKTDRTVRNLAIFLSVQFPTINLASYGRNSSHSGRASTKEVTDTEIWICQAIIGDISKRLGFCPSAKAGLSFTGIISTVQAIIFSLYLFFDEYLFSKEQRTKLFRLLAHRAD